MNSVVIMGRLGKDPEIRVSQNNTKVARFSLAVDRRFKKDVTDWLNCVAFGKTAEFIEKYFHKGMRMCASGSIQIDSYKNKDGQTVYNTYIAVDECEFCESKGNTSNGNAETGGTNFMDIPADLDEELPFC